MSLFVQEYLEGAWVDLGTATKCWHDFKTGRLERVTCEDITIQVNVCVNGRNKKRVLDMSLVLGYIRAANRWQNNFNKKAVYRVVDAEGVSVGVKKMLTKYILNFFNSSN